MGHPAFLPAHPSLCPLLKTESLAHLHRGPLPAHTEELTWYAGVAVTFKAITF